VQDALRWIELDAIRLAQRRILNVCPSNVPGENGRFRAVVVLRPLREHVHGRALLRIDGQGDLLERVAVRRQADPGAIADRPVRPDAEDPLLADGFRVVEPGEKRRRLTAFPSGRNLRGCLRALARDAVARPEERDEKREEGDSEGEDPELRARQSLHGAAGTGRREGDERRWNVVESLAGHAFTISISGRPLHRLRESR
jgi:hypothetical protein